MGVESSQELGSSGHLVLSELLADVISNERGRRLQNRGVLTLVPYWRRVPVHK